ncbi:excisionase family DNA-binding protein [Bacillus sp. MM2020_1]|nr:excisionase family DNA-binding protein [Bacillus sp. MM2020_1]
MYLTVKETAEYLSVPEATVKSLIHQKKIRALFDGEEVNNNI